MEVYEEKFNELFAGFNSHTKKDDALLQNLRAPIRAMNDYLCKEVDLNHDDTVLHFIDAFGCKIYSFIMQRLIRLFSLNPCCFRYSFTFQVSQILREEHCKYIYKDKPECIACMAFAHIRTIMLKSHDKLRDEENVPCYEADKICLQLYKKSYPLVYSKFLSRATLFLYRTDYRRESYLGVEEQCTEHI